MCSFLNKICNGKNYLFTLQFIRLICKSFSFKSVKSLAFFLSLFFLLKKFINIIYIFYLSFFCWFKRHDRFCFFFNDFNFFIMIYFFLLNFNDLLLLLSLLLLRKFNNCFFVGFDRPSKARLLFTQNHPLYRNTLEKDLNRHIETSAHFFEKIL